MMDPYAATEAAVTYLLEAATKRRHSVQFDTEEKRYEVVWRSWAGYGRIVAYVYANLDGTLRLEKVEPKVRAIA